MTQCIVCQKGPAPEDGGVTVYRINPMGQEGIWACERHLKDMPLAPPVDPEVQEIVHILERDPTDA